MEGEHEGLCPLEQTLLKIYLFSLFIITVKQVFSDMDFLGWYTTGDTPTDKDIAIHRQICEINECPVMLMLNPAGRNGDVSAPTVLYFLCTM